MIIVWVKWDMLCLFCFWINNIVCIDLGGKSYFIDIFGGKVILFISFYFYNGLKYEFVLFWRNVGTDLFIFLSLLGWENWLLGSEGIVEIRE